MRLLLSNNKQVENSVNKDGMETWGNQLYRPEARLHRLTQAILRRRRERRNGAISAGFVDCWGIVPVTFTASKQ
jgi:hypothetical protein